VVHPEAVVGVAEKAAGVTAMAIVVAIEEETTGTVIVGAVDPANVEAIVMETVVVTDMVTVIAEAAIAEAAIVEAAIVEAATAVVANGVAAATTMAGGITVAIEMMIAETGGVVAVTTTRGDEIDTAMHLKAERATAEIEAVRAVMMVPATAAEVVMMHQVDMKVAVRQHQATKDLNHVIHNNWRKYST